MDDIGNALSSHDLTRVNLDQLGEALAGLHRFARITKKELVRRQMSAIESARERGVGYTAIASAFTASGCVIDARVLRKYVHQLRRAANRCSPVAKAVTSNPFEAEPPPMQERALTPHTSASPHTQRRSLSRSALVAASNPGNAMSKERTHGNG